MWRSLRRQPQPPDPPVVRIRTAFDEALLLQTVYKPGDGDRRHLGDRGELILRNARLPVQTAKDNPLRASHPRFPGHLVHACARQAREVVEKHEWIVFEIWVH